LFSKQFLSISVAVGDGHVERVGPVLLVLKVSQEVDQVLKKIRQSSEMLV
jgi:hypothetical protein